MLQHRSLFLKTNYQGKAFRGGEGESYGGGRPVLLMRVICVVCEGNVRRIVGGGKPADQGVLRSVVCPTSHHFRATEK